MVSPRRRQVIIGGLASAVLPVVSFASTERLILSGRLLRQGKPVAGAMINDTVTDADGRFVLVTHDYRGISCDRGAVEGFVLNRRRDADGTWRATCALRLA